MAGIPVGVALRNTVVLAVAVIREEAVAMMERERLVQRSEPAVVAQEHLVHLVEEEAQFVHLLLAVLGAKMVTLAMVMVPAAQVDLLALMVKVL
ncbi:hypothetical protein V462_25320 [Pantoea ananatis 15320]|uniref:hypothetical protein n=1 Tax=Pantoea ananas TaxID=553 RepID=UPI001EE57839|nr:hypothetical protein [Pantoea ananatis]PKC27824.1 hypothetical protein V462_25320 [Pantoea ananatis 15320]